MLNMPNALGNPLAFRRYFQVCFYEIGGGRGCELRGWLKAHPDHQLIQPMYFGLEFKQHWNINTAISENVEVQSTLLLPLCYVGIVL
jgi:hypothetical protein